MKFKLEFKMDNAAFSEFPELEIKRILWEIADKVELGYTDNSIMDANGNNVGHWEIEV